MLADGEEEHAVTAISAATPAANPATGPVTAFIVPSSFIQVSALCADDRHDGSSSPISASVSGESRGSTPSGRPSDCPDIARQCCYGAPPACGLDGLGANPRAKALCAANLRRSPDAVPGVLARTSRYGETKVGSPGPRRKNVLVPDGQ